MAVKERRRRRWAELAPTALAVAGVVLDQAARQVELFPVSWRPYVLIASAAFGISAMIERAERAYDYHRWSKTLDRQRNA